MVEIDESKFGKRKYNRGHRVEDVWVFGAVEKTEERRFAAFTVESRDQDTLLDIITEYIHPGSIMHSDGWAAYRRLPELGYRYEVVNHSEGFGRADGMSTNTIEGKSHSVPSSVVNAYSFFMFCRCVEWHQNGYSISASYR